MCVFALCHCEYILDQLAYFGAKLQVSGKQSDSNSQVSSDDF